jgi:hypothetical protein
MRQYTVYWKPFESMIGAMHFFSAAKLYASNLRLYAMRYKKANMALTREI